MIDDEYKYIRMALNADRNLLAISATNMSTINLNQIGENIEYVYVSRVKDLVLSDDDLLWSKLDGYLDPQDDPEFKQYEYFKERLIERYGSI